MHTKINRAGFDFFFNVFYGYSYAVLNCVFPIVGLLNDVYELLTYPKYMNIKRNEFYFYFSVDTCIMFVLKKLNNTSLVVLKIRES